MKIKRTRRPYSVFRIHRTEEMKKIGLGDKQDYFETYVFHGHAVRNKLKTAILGKDYMAATQFREVNKGYPKGFETYRTYNERNQKRLFGETREERNKRKHISDLKIWSQ